MKANEKKVKQQHKGQKRIAKALMSAFAVLILICVVQGGISSVVASVSVTKQVKNSAESSVSATDDLFEMLVANLQTKITETILDEKLIEFYTKYYEEKDRASSVMRENFQYDLGITQITLEYLEDFFVCAEQGKCMYSTMAKFELPRETYKSFLTTEQSAFLESNNKNLYWFGYHDFIDTPVQHKTDDYAFYLLSKFADKAKVKGIVVFDVSRDYVSKAFNNLELLNGSIKGIVTADGRETVVKQKTSGGETVNELYEVDTVVFSDQEFFRRAVESTEDQGMENVHMNGKAYLFNYSKVANSGLIICTLVPITAIYGQNLLIYIATIVSLILAASIALILGSRLAKAIGGEVKNIEGAMNLVENGDLTVSVTTKRKDEFKALADSITGMIKSVRSLISDISGFSAKVEQSSGEVYNTSETVHTAMESISLAMNDVATGVSQQAEDTEQCMSKMNDFSDKIQSICEKTDKMNRSTDQAINALHQGRNTVTLLNEKSEETMKVAKGLVENIAEVQHQSDNIGGIVNTINEIAEQTNLLSLNASIEAARAGEHGRGFAVVAEEIRKLADQSVVASDEIHNIIESICETTKTTSAAAARTESILRLQQDSLTETNKIFEEIQNCVEELISGLQETLQNMNRMTDSRNDMVDSISSISSVSQQVAASAEEVTATISEQLTMIRTLSQKAEFLDEKSKELAGTVKKYRV